MNFRTDKLYASSKEKISEFIFNEQVADVFPDMITRSVPGYSDIIYHIGVLAQRYAQPDTTIYDLGCSLGAATLSMRHSVNHKDCRIIAVDNSNAMLKRCKAHIVRDNGRIQVETLCEDIEKIKITNASVVVMNFTLQFIDPGKRDKIINKIYHGLVPGGVLILSEKIRFQAEERQMLYDKLYYDFKRFNGYSDLEISQKREALENVLIRDSEKDHINRMKTSGFNLIEIWFKCLNFVSFLAKK